MIFQKVAPRHLLHYFLECVKTEKSLIDSSRSPFLLPQKVLTSAAASMHVNDMRLDY